MARQTSSRYCFTINNPSPDEKDKVAEFLQDNDKVRYGIIGRETGASGTPHLQGFVIFNRQQRFNFAKRNIGDRCHLECTRGTSVQARDYCKKDGDFDEYGSFPNKQGKRNDLEEVFTWASEFERDNERPPTEREIACEYPTIHTKYPRIYRTIQLRADIVAFNPVVFNEWQQELKEKLDTDADDRVVNFIVDTEGGKGKTTFCRQLLTDRPKDVQVFNGVGKTTDLTYALDVTKKIFIFNVPRGKMEFVSYVLFEQLKDKMVWSGKYGSTMKMLRHNVHIVVMCNEWPDLTKMTHDRYVTYSISDNTLNLVN